MDTLAVDADDLIAQRTEEGWNGWPADGKIGHLHLKTHDIGQARDFYVEQIGLEHISNFPQALFMSTQKYHHHIATNVWQSNQARTDNETTYGLFISIYINQMLKKNILHLLKALILQFTVIQVSFQDNMVNIWHRL